MKTLLIYIYIVFFAISCDTNSNSGLRNPKSEHVQVIDDSIIYLALNYLLADKSYNHFLKYDKLSEKGEIIFPFQLENDSLELRTLDTIFSTKDMDFILNQKESFYKFKIDQNKIKNKIVISVDSLDLVKNRPYSFITLPLFNLKKDIFIISIGYYCGLLCAEGGTFIFQKKGDRWIKIKTLNEWIS